MCDVCRGCEVNPGGGPPNGLRSGDCGQHWAVIDGTWKAVSRIRYKGLYAAEAARQLAEKEKADLERLLRAEDILGPTYANKLTTIYDGMPEAKLYVPDEREDIWRLTKEGAGALLDRTNWFDEETYTMLGLRNYVPWQADWPEEVPYYWRGFDGQGDFVDFIWESPFDAIVNGTATVRKCRVPASVLMSYGWMPSKVSTKLISRNQ